MSSHRKKENKIFCTDIFVGVAVTEPGHVVSAYTVNAQFGCPLIIVCTINAYKHDNKKEFP